MIESWVERVSEVDTYCKLLRKVQTMVGCAEKWTSHGLLEPLGPSVLATRESLVGLLESKLTPIFWKSESGIDPSATWCKVTKLKMIRRNPQAENCGDAPQSIERQCNSEMAKMVEITTESEAPSYECATV